MNSTDKCLEKVSCKKFVGSIDTERDNKDRQMSTETEIIKGQFKWRSGRYLGELESHLK